MPKGVNEVRLLGNVGRDPEIRSSNSGITIASFSLATAERRKDGANWVDHTEWHNIKAFGRTADVVRDYVQKGSQLYVSGRLNTESWEDKKSGQTKYRTVIIGDNIVLLGGKQEGGGGQRSRQSGGYSDSSDYSDQGITDDDIPF